ncbi:hypothetical protein KSP39_PZI007514 [Platanthera zijinensis]|uniref:Uncharacterized protein n=1 Tax=Platanthera zijinensis TaxID=2320716 RepID=A0AAP0G8P4_9ASPA
MAMKRLCEDPQNIHDKPEGKKMRSLRSFTMSVTVISTFCSQNSLFSEYSHDRRMLFYYHRVIREAVVAKSIQNFCLALEPLVRRVVQEEVERGLLHRACLSQRSPQMIMEKARPSSKLQLIFKKPPSLPIFTENRLEDEDGFPLEILLVDAHAGKRPQETIPSSIKVEIVVLDGDFPFDECESWSSVDFNRSIVKERKGKRPLLAGDNVITLKDGEASIHNLKFTDNSSWIKSRHFRIGVKVLQGNQKYLSIREAVTGRFMVKDHPYKKHHPPALGDEVWRLEKIGKDGVFHKKLAAENINTVQDFLKLSVVDAAGLRKMVGMPDRSWDATLNHARTCPLGDKLYVHNGPQYAVVLNPICEVVSIEIDGISCTFKDLSMPSRATVEQLVIDAYKRWNSLDEISLPLQGESMNQVVVEPSYQFESFLGVGLIQTDVPMELSNWSPVMQNVLL